MNSNVDSLLGESLRNLRAKQGFSLGHSQYKQLLLGLTKAPRFLPPPAMTTILVQHLQVIIPLG